MYLHVTFKSFTKGSSCVYIEHVFQILNNITTLTLCRLSCSGQTWNLIISIHTYQQIQRTPMVLGQKFSFQRVKFYMTYHLIFYFELGNNIQFLNGVMSASIYMDIAVAAFHRSNLLWVSLMLQYFILKILPLFIGQLRLSQIK